MLARKEINGIVNGQIQDIEYVFPLEGNFKDFIPEPFPFSTFAGKVDISHKLHFDRDFTFALAFFTSSTFNVKRKVGGFEAGVFGALQFGV